MNDHETVSESLRRYEELKESAYTEGVNEIRKIISQQNRYDTLRAIYDVLNDTYWMLTNSKDEDTAIREIFQISREAYDKYWEEFTAYTESKKAESNSAFVKSIVAMELCVECHNDIAYVSGFRDAASNIRAMLSSPKDKSAVTEAIDKIVLMAESRCDEIFADMARCHQMEEDNEHIRDDKLAV